MTRSSASWALLGLLLLGSGCAGRSAPTAKGGTAALTVRPPAAPAVESLLAQPPSPLPAQAASPLLPQPTAENQTFVTVSGVPHYKIGPGDVLEILLKRGLAEQKQTAQVKASGAVTVASFDAKVAGLDSEQAAQEIERVLSPFYRQVSVEVLVKEYNSKRVSVLGAVAGKTGAVPLKGRTTLVDLLFEVGGPAPNADLERVRLVRQDGASWTVNLFRLLEEPGAQGVVLDAGDLVLVPVRLASAAGATVGAAAPEERKVFVLGQVKNPGAVPFLPNMRLSQAVAMAGGPTDIAVLESARIIRGGVDNPQLVETDFGKVIEQGDRAQDLPLQPSDLIVMPRSKIGDWNAFLTKLRPTLEFIILPFSIPLQFQLFMK